MGKNDKPRMQEIADKLTLMAREMGADGAVVTVHSTSADGTTAYHTSWSGPMLSAYGALHRAFDIVRQRFEDAEHNAGR